MGFEGAMTTLVEAIADAVVERLRPHLSRAHGDETSPATPWMTMREAIAYTRIGEGTFRKDVAAGVIPSHTRPGADGRASRYFHRAELDAMLGYVPGDESHVVPLRKAS